MALKDILNPRICELGKIKIGGLGAERQGANGPWRMPRKDDFFTITTLNRTPAKDLIPDTALMDSLAPKFADSDKKIRRLPIYVLSNNLDDVMQSAWVFYSGKRCVARSDGITIQWFFDRKTRKWLDIPETEPHRDEIVERRDDKGHPTFKLHTTFNCVIASEEGRWGGVYKFRTTSRITADQLYGSLIHVAGLTHGQLAGIPLMLVVRPIQVAPEGKPTTVYVCHVEIRGKDMLTIQKTAVDLAKTRARNATEIRQLENQYKRMLALPGGESPEEIGDLQNEFNSEIPPDATPTAEDETDPLLLGDAEVIEPTVAADPNEEMHDANIDPIIDTPAEPSQRPRDVSTWMLFKGAINAYAKANNFDVEQIDKMLSWIALKSPDVKKETKPGQTARESFYSDFINGKKIGDFQFGGANG